MKNLFLLVGIAFLAFSCSSDDNGEDPVVPTERTQYEVSYYLSKADIEKQPQATDKSRLFILPKTDKQPSGNSGLLFYEIPVKKYKVYDACCPVDWGDGKSKKHQLTIKEPQSYELFRVYCDECNSSFDLMDGHPTDGYAKNRNISLIEYKVSRDPVNINEEEIGVYITNPNYKKK